MGLGEPGRTLHARHLEVATRRSHWLLPWITVLLLFVLVASILAPAPAIPHETGGGPLRVNGVSPFGDNIRITDGSSPFLYQVEPYIAIDSQNSLFVGWKEADSAEGPGRRVGFAHSQDGGGTWSPNELMERRASNRFQSDPWLVVDETDRLYYSRLEFENGPIDGVAVSSSDDGGESWSAIAEVDDRLGFADKESMVSDGNGTLYLAYDDVPQVGDNVSVRFTYSTDRGVTWASTTEVGGIPGLFLAPVIGTRPNGTVYVSWLDLFGGDILVSTSWDRGGTWGSPVRVNPVPGTASFDTARPWWISLPSMATDSQGRIFVAWPDRGRGDLDVLVARSEDDGKSWSAPVRINDDTSGREQRMISLAIDPDDRVHAAWYDNRTGNLNIFYSNSTDGGNTWFANAKVTTAETPGTFRRPGDYLGLATDGNGTPYVVWTDGRGVDLDIYFATLAPPEEGDTEAPTIEIIFPEEGQAFTSRQLTVSGTAEDNVAVDRVEIRSDGFTWIMANGTASWSGSLEVPLGETTVRARATDTSDNVAFASVTVSVSDEPEELFAPDPLVLILLATAAVAVGLVLWWRTRGPRT